MRTVKGSRRGCALLIGLALVPLTQADTQEQPRSPQKSATRKVSQSMTQSAAQGTVAAATPKWQSGMGEWVGAPCRMVVSADDAKSVEGDCYTASLHHYFHMTYAAPDRIEGTVTRVDPSGCQITVALLVHITDENNIEYTHPGFTGCGIVNAGPANAYPVRRAHPIAASAASTPSSGAAAQSGSHPASGTAAKSTAAAAAHPPTRTAAQSKSGVAGTVPPAKPEATTTLKRPVKPTLKPPLKLPEKPVTPAS